MKKSIGKRTILFPHPVLIVSAYDKYNKPNMMAVSWGGICSSDPPSIAVSIRKHRYTYDCLIQNMAFAVNIPSEKYIKEADFAGVISGKDKNKFLETGLTPVKSELVNAPYIEEFPMSLICKVSHIYELGVHTQFIGEIVDVVASEEYLNEKGLPDIGKIQPFSYNSVDKCYYGTGEKLIPGYTIRNIK